jgi:hypothetical protein
VLQATTQTEFTPVPAADRDYADWYEAGEAWVRANSPARNDYGIRQLVLGWMQIHCPAKLIAEHRAAVKAVRDAEYGAAPFKVTLFGLERVS